MKADRILTVLIVMAVSLAILTGFRPEWLGCRESAGNAAAIPVVLPAGKEVLLLIRRIRMKDLITERLNAGELTLVEAAAAFLHLNTTPAELQDHSWRNQPGADDGERVCRQVIYWAAGRWGDNCPDDAVKNRLNRLEQELREHITAHGGVRLPCHVPEE